MKQEVIKDTKWQQMLFLGSKNYVQFTKLLQDIISYIDVICVMNNDHSQSRRQ